MEEGQLVSSRRRNADMVQGLFGLLGSRFEDTSELERQVIAAFAFGMVFAAGRLERLQAYEVHALSIAVLVDAFRYSSQQATDFAGHLIEVSSDRSKHPFMSAIIHRGIDGHYEWQNGNNERLRANLSDVLERAATSR